MTRKAQSALAKHICKYLVEFSLMKSCRFIKFTKLSSCQNSCCTAVYMVHTFTNKILFFKARGTVHVYSNQGIRIPHTATTQIIQHSPCWDIFLQFPRKQLIQYIIYQMCVCVCVCVCVRVCARVYACNIIDVLIIPYNAHLECELFSVNILNMKVPCCPGSKVVGTIIYLPSGKLQLSKTLLELIYVTVPTVSWMT